MEIKFIFYSKKFTSLILILCRQQEGKFIVVLKTRENSFNYALPLL